MPLFDGYGHRVIRQVTSEDLQGHSLAYVEGYTNGCISVLDKRSVSAILAVLEAMQPQARDDKGQPSTLIPTFIRQKLKMYRRYVPEYSELMAKKYKPDVRPHTLPAYRPTTNVGEPDFLAGYQAGIEALNTLYERYINHFRTLYTTNPRPEPWVVNTDHRREIEKSLAERDAKVAVFDADLRKSAKPAVVKV